MPPIVPDGVTQVLEAVFRYWSYCRAATTQNWLNKSEIYTRRYLLEMEFLKINGMQA